MSPCIAVFLLALATASCAKHPDYAGGDAGTGGASGTGTGGAGGAAVAAVNHGLLGFKWTSSLPLVAPKQDATHPIVSLKDPSVVYYKDRWHVFATTANTAKQWSLVYFNFADWSEADAAPLTYLDTNPNLKGYHAAPQIFYFAPQSKWYLIFQSGQPQYSTNDDISNPAGWTAPVNFFTAEPAGVTANKGAGFWLDFFVICDDANCHLFFTDDDGELFRSQTTLANFPMGFGDAVVAIQGTKDTLFEGSSTYRIKGKNAYLTLVEAFGPTGNRFYRSFVASDLAGTWTPLADSWTNPFAGTQNVTFPGGTAWTNDISHGELIRAGYDQKLELDPANLQMLYQGSDPAMTTGVEYSQIPYRLALLTPGTRGTRVTGSDTLPIPPGAGNVAKPAGTPGNLKVVDWAGFKAAVTYTFDDAQPSQIEHYADLQSTGVRHTFFITSNGPSNGGAYDSTFMQAVKDGHEMGNHTVHHCHADFSDCAKAPGTTLTMELDGCNDYIATHFGQNAVWTAASPFGDVNYNAPGMQRFLLNRGVQSGAIAPKDNTNPFDLPCHPAVEGETVDMFNTVIDTTRAAGKWVIMLIHTLTPTANSWYAPIDISVVKDSVARAKTFGDVWIDSMVNVGAYWRGQKVLSLVTPTVSTDGKTSTWTWMIPPHFPPGTKLRVTVDGGTLTQKGMPVAWDPHGYYEIAFDIGSLTLSP